MAERDTSWVPPYIDVYGVDRFLAAYAPRARQLRDLEVTPYDEPTVNDTYGSAAELLAAMRNRESRTFETFADAIVFGIDNTSVAFTLTLPRQRTDRRVDCGASVTFTFDGQAVFGWRSTTRMNARRSSH